MTDNNPTLASLAATLAEVSKQLEAIRGGENTPELDPNDPLNETSEHPWCAPDATNSEDERADNTISEWGAPRTIRNFLEALVSRENADSWYTVRSLVSRKRYRISRVDDVSRITKPDGYSFSQSRTHDFTLPIGPEELTAGWVIGTTAKVLDVFEVGGKKYTIYEMLD